MAGIAMDWGVREPRYGLEITGNFCTYGESPNSQFCKFGPCEGCCLVPNSQTSQGKSRERSLSRPKGLGNFKTCRNMCLLYPPDLMPEFGHVTVCDASIGWHSMFITRFQLHP